MKKIVLTAVVVFLIGCSNDDNPFRGDPPPGTGDPDVTAPALLITALPESVKVESVFVLGTASDENGISSVTINNVAATLGIGHSSAAPVFTYYAKIELSPGRNTVTVVATDNSTGKNKRTELFLVVYDPLAVDNVSPVIIISSPSDSDTILTSSPSLSGLVYDPGGSIALFTINCGRVVPDAVGWTVNVQLGHPGWSDIYFKAVDGAGNVTRDTLHLYFNGSENWGGDGPYPPDLPSL